jgi:outer membrane beta-barrel protein
MNFTHRMWFAALLVGTCLVGPATGHAQGKDEDDEEEPAKKPAPAPTTPAPAPTPAKPAAPVAPAPTAAPAASSDVPASTSPAAPAAAPEIKLTGGAPLNDPDVKVHTVQRKVLADKGRSEVVVFPAVAQVNGKFTNHLGVAAEYLYHFQENVAFQITPSYYYVNGESAFNEDLVNIAQLQAQAATALTMIWNAEAGVEATPIYGKIAFYENHMAQFSLVLDAGLGLAQTRVQLRPATTDRAASFGDTGLRFMGNVGGGFRIRVGEHWAVRLEVRDQVYTAAVNTVNGCKSEDLEQIVSGGQPVNASCNVNKFAEGDPALARALVKVPSSDVLNQINFYGGIAYIF